MQVWTKFANEYFAPALMLLGWHERMAPQMGSADRNRNRDAAVAAACRTGKW